ncbi:MULTISPECIES: aldehyde dehydrogenase family protein [Stenotrophomonas]|jgi:acyl-CoA reductase-like NAD-dependent aldehyde dehydrogenase|uniref:Aldehyde dehydrogenase family protein n=1 Tax=Stenotrophomonas maltophilia TaxID=40324 RepID=A0A4S2D1X5_STEMA|nr:MULTISPECIES: aldehyde dehydrogenase family protein [Stenotrophomonas]MBD3826865.1 aldehyde dehydrogenase family protein [Stenotrophomonas sp.]TGY34144.1 aldehyde dehydrogenase family protein [Stenotrophomonas maltophilia]
MLTVVQAFDRAPIAEIGVDSAAALERKLSAAERVFKDRDGWLHPHQRVAILRRLAALMDARREHLALQIAREGGKPLPDAIVETTRAIDGVHNAADELRNFAGREIPMGLSAAAENRWAFTTREPIGIVAAISAFNHPLNLIVHQVAPAIAVGCPVIIKPASSTPLSCLEFVAMVHEAGLPEPWCQSFLPEGNDLAEALATDRRIAFLSFIGSARVGWSLHAKLAHGARAALEHGGVAPAIVDRSADLPGIIEPIVKGGYYHAGQVCVSTQRIFVHDAIAEDFTQALIARVERLRTGDPTLQTTEVGPLIQPREADRVAEWIDEAVRGGAQLVAGGRRLSDTTLQPTVLLNPPGDARITTQEVFGPVVAVYRYAGLDEAIARANALPTAFQASVFAQDIDIALRAANRLDASAVMINDPTAFRTDWMPFAGRRESGYGTGGIPYTMRDMSQEKMILMRRR